MKHFDLPGGMRVEVVGESYYAAALSGLVDDGVKVTWASLVPEPTNPYDRNAVQVHINGIQVGHLGREATIAFMPVSKRIRELGCEARCAATIAGAHGVYGVVLELGTPDQCLECLQ